MPVLRDVGLPGLSSASECQHATPSTHTRQSRIGTAFNQLLLVPFLHLFIASSACREFVDDD